MYKIDFFSLIELQHILEGFFSLLYIEFPCFSHLGCLSLECADRLLSADLSSNICTDRIVWFSARVNTAIVFKACSALWKKYSAYNFFKTA